MMALRREEGRGVQHGWAEIKCERGETPIAHSGSPWNLSGPPKGHTLYSPRPCPTHRQTRYELPSSCTTYVIIIELSLVCVSKLQFSYFTRKQPLWNPHCQQISAADLAVVHCKQNEGRTSYKNKNKSFFLFCFLNAFFMSQTIAMKINVFSGCHPITEMKCCWTRDRRQRFLHPCLSV